MARGLSALILGVLALRVIWPFSSMAGISFSPASVSAWKPSSKSALRSVTKIVDWTVRGGWSVVVERSWLPST